VRSLLISSRAYLLADLIARDTSLEQLPGNVPKAEIESAIRTHQPHLIVIFGCNTILPLEFLANASALNLHSSFLPWCRGPMPHLWTFIEGAPVGVSIHLLDAGIDSGPVIAQERVAIDPDAYSLQTAYDLLHARAALLFARKWPSILAGDYCPIPQPSGGSYHTMKMQEPFQEFLDRHLNAPLSWLITEIKKNWPSAAETA
jgi:methionyl-tRNA formyltransferase